jgi:hypothetical protein
MQALLATSTPCRDGRRVTTDDQPTSAASTRTPGGSPACCPLLQRGIGHSGPRHRDPLRRLAKEIEKSRQAFSSRVPAHLKGATRYLDEEMVRVLAEGDPGLLKG